MTGPAVREDDIPDFSAYLSTAAPKSAVPDDDTDLPDFSEFQTPQTNFARDLNPRLRGLMDGVSGIGDFIVGSLATMGELQSGRVTPETVEQLQKVGANLKGMKQGFVDDPVGATKAAGVGLVEGLLVQPLSDLLKVMTGLDPEAPSRFEVTMGRFGPIVTLHGKELSDDELAEATKLTAVNVLSFVTGAKAETMVAQSLTGLKPYIGGKGLAAIGRAAGKPQIAEIVSGTGLATRELLDMSKAGKLAAMPFAQRAISGVAGGVVGGVTYGYLGAEEDRMSSAITMAIVAAPLGVAFTAIGETVRVAKGAAADPAEVARNVAASLAKVREFNGLVDKAPLEILLNLNNIQETKSMVAARARSVIDYDFIVDPVTQERVKQGINAAVVPDVEAATIPDVLNELTPHPDKPEAIAVIHPKGNGMHDILIAPVDTPEPVKKFFEKTGYMQGQQVTYGGNDRFVIQEATKSGRDWNLTLRNMITEEHIENVKTKDVIRPTGKYMGDLALYQTRKLTLTDMTRAELGLAQKENSFTKGDVSSTQHRYNEIDVEPNLGSYSAYALDSFDNPTKFISQRESTGSPNRPQEIPFERNTVMELRDGSSVTAVYIDKDMQPAAILTWVEQPSEFGGTIKRSSNQWHFQNSPNKSDASIAMAKYRADKKIMTSNSTVSMGAQKAMLRRLNENHHGRRYSEFGVFDSEVFLQDATTSFLDHIALLDDDVHISPEEVVNRIGVVRQNKASMISGIGETIKTVERAREGLPIKEYSDVGQVTGVTYRTAAENRTISEPRAAARIAVETESGHIPEVTTKPSAVEPLTTTSDMTFQDMFDSWAQGMELKPRVQEALKNHFQFEFGRLLKGESNVLRKYTDKSTLPFLKQRATELGEAISLSDKLTSGSLTPDKINETIAGIEDKLRIGRGTVMEELTLRIAEARRAKSIFEARAKQLETPVKLELSPAEQVKMQELYAKAKVERERSAHDLIEVAHANGYYVDRGYGGAIEVRDMDTHLKMPVAFLDETAATQWIKDTGRVNPRDIDGGSNNLVPPESIGGGLIPSPGQGPAPHQMPYDFAPDTKVGRIMELFDQQWPRLTMKRAYFSAVDGTLKTKFFEEVYQPLQTAKMESLAKKRPFLERVKNDVEEILVKAKVPRERWSMITDYRETMTPAEIDKNYFKNRALTPQEVEHSHWLANNNIDVAKVYKYNRDVYEMRQELRVQYAKMDPQAPDTPARKDALSQEYEAKFNALKDDLKMDSVHLEASKLYDFIKTQSLDALRLDAVTRRARSLMNKEMSRSAFAKYHKMSAAELRAANALDLLYHDVAGTAGISESFTNYVNHNRVEGEGVDYPINLKDSKLDHAQEKETAALANTLVRSGEIQDYQRDPVHAAVNYINRVLDHKTFNTVWNDARTAAIKNLRALPPDAREYASRIVGEYVYGMKGVPNAHDQYSRAMVTKFFEEIGMVEKDKKFGPKEEQMVTDLSDVLLASSSAALLGGRPAQGIRDLHGFMRNYWARFGTARLAKGFRLAFERDSNGKLPIHTLAEEGKVPGLSILAFLSEEEVAAAQAGKSPSIRNAVMAAAKVGLTTSGQHNVYALAHAMAYLEVRSFSQPKLLQLSRGNVTKKQVYKDLKIDTYDIPVAEAFDNLITQGKFDEATEFLAQATGTETAFIYGLQNHPYGWGSKAGRIMGQMGQWPVWNRDFLARLASRGTASQRAAAMSRYAIAEAMLWTAGRATGFNVKSWYGIPGILFAGSPLMGLASQMGDMIGLRGESRQRAATTVYGGKVPVLSMFIPGAMAFADYYQAWELAEKRYGPVPVIGRALGLGVDRSQRSWFDEMTSQYPRLSR